MTDVGDCCLPGSPPEVPGYRLQGKIGEGGRGEVHKATQLSLHRTVAVKFLHAPGGARATRLALERESRAMAASASRAGSPPSSRRPNKWDARRCIVKTCMPARIMTALQSSIRSQA
jgi:serine/threonine protein kinase